PNLEQALKRLELQVSPGVLTRSTAPAPPDARAVTGSAASVADKPASDKPATDDPLMNDPNDAYRTEVIAALKDAMLAHSSALGIGPTEWLTIAAKGN